MKYLLFLMLGLWCITSKAQEENSNDTLKLKENPTFYEIDLMSRNVWRGIDFGDLSPSSFVLVGASFDNFEIGTYSIFSLLGNNEGYSNTFNVYMSYTLNNFKLTLDDYYFKGHYTNIETKFLDYKNTHFLEARLDYTYNNFNFLTSYSLYSGEYYVVDYLDFDNRKGFYMEANCEFDHTGFTIGYLTKESALNFHDSEGFTNLKLYYFNDIKRSKKICEFETGIVYNPNYDNIAPLDQPRFGYGVNQFNYYLNIIFN